MTRPFAADPMRHRWVRAVATVAWCAFAAYVTLVLAGRGDALGYVQALGWGVLAVGEAVALWTEAQHDTISERVSGWLYRRPVRAALLVVGMLVCLAHWLVGYP